MIDIRSFTNLEIQGGFVIREVEFTDKPMVDALGREAVATTRIVGRELRIAIRAGLPDNELSITFYHEVLEAATLAALSPPATVVDFNEGSFERAAKEAYQKWGEAAPASINDMLLFYGFGEK
jgi:hypothetical protein